jgi:AbrB family looped-hinge helix DNA binding protein
VDALLTLFSKGQPVIPARLRQLLGLNPGDRLELSLEADGLILGPIGSGKTSSAPAQSMTRRWPARALGTTWRPMR